MFSRVQFVVCDLQTSRGSLWLDVCDQDTCRLTESVVVSGGLIIFTMSRHVYTQTDESSWWNSVVKRATEWFLPFLFFPPPSWTCWWISGVRVSVMFLVFFCQIPNLELCVVSLCFRHSLFFFLCCRFYCFVNNFPTTRPELLWLCVSFGGYFFFSFLFFFSLVFFFCRLSQPEQQRNKSETPTNRMLESISAAAHSTLLPRRF